MQKGLIIYDVEITNDKNMSNEQSEQPKLNSLGKPMSRVNGKFAKGNQESKRFGIDIAPPGRPKGSRNLMTIIKEVALEKSSNDGKTNIEFIACGLVESARELKRIIDKMDEDDPRRPKLVSRYGDLSAKIMEHLTKYSGDYTQKIQAELGENITDEERELIERQIRQAAGKDG